MSSRHRLYLNLKQSITKLFKTPAHYLKELLGKHSLFEKPYLGGDYQQMHLNLPVPSWTQPQPKAGGLWPPPGGSYWSQFVFQEGKCSFYDKTGECGELITFEASINQLTMGPHSSDLTYAWNATSSNPELAIIQPIEQHLFGASATIPIQLSEENTGTVTICVTAQIASGSFIKDIKFPVPLPWWDPKYDYRWQSLQYMLANVFPIAEHRLEAKRWDCGCVDVEVICCDGSGMAWDSSTSAEYVARNNDCVVAITDSLDAGGPYSWEVSGTGFSLDFVKTEGLVNELNALWNACRTATITVTGCDGTQITGEVRCTYGDWSMVSSCNVYDTDNALCSCFYADMDSDPWHRYWNFIHCAPIASGSCDTHCDSDEGGYWCDGDNEPPCDACAVSVGAGCGEDKTYRVTVSRIDDWVCP